MFDWSKSTADPCDPTVRLSIKNYLLSIRKPFLGRLIDFFTSVCAGKSVLHLGFVEHSAEYVNQPSWKHALIADVASRTVGIDISADGVRVAQERGYEGHVMDITTSAHLDEKFEVIVAGDIIEHLMSLESLYRFSIRHMRRGSKLFISTPNPGCALWIREAAAGQSYVSNFEHTCWISPSQINEHARRVNMALEHYYPILGGANIGPITRAVKRAAFHICPELVAGTNVFELSLSDVPLRTT